VYLLVYSLILVHLADAISTIIFRKLGIKEANPLLRKLDEFLTPLPNTGKWLWLLLPKLLVISLQWWLLWLYWPAAWVVWFTIFFIVLYIGVVGWNSYNIYLRLKKLGKLS